MEDRRRIVKLAVVALPFALAGASSCRVYDAPVLRVDANRVAAGMSQVVACTIHDSVGGTHATASGSCHTQGISRYLDTTVTSCQDGDADQGILDFFFLPITEYADPNAWAQPLTLAPTDLREGLDHAAVGQALQPVSGALKDALVPVVSSATESTPARVDLYDGLATPVCNFTHRAAPGSDASLGAAALFTVQNVVYLAACSWNCDWFYIYELDPMRADCGSALLSASAVADDAGLRAPIPGSSDRSWATYNSVAVFQRGDQSPGDLYLAAGHDGWLDTWQMVGALTGAPSFEKTAKAHWGENQAHHGDKEMLFEGMTLQQIDGDSLDLWMAPHDFGSCSGGRECVRAVYQCRLDF